MKSNLDDWKAALQEAVQHKAILHSVFDRISLDDAYTFKAGRRTAYMTSTLNAEGVVAGGPALTQEALLADLVGLERLHGKAQTDTFTFLLQKYGWRVAKPSDAEAGSDIAFCDAFRVEQALAQAGPNGQYRLVKGDLSGIQAYIYSDIQQKTAGGLSKVSKRLRGRSISVTLLTDFVANTLLRSLELPPWHLIFAGGGHFTLLLPDDAVLVTRFWALTAQLERAIAGQFGEHLRLLVADVVCDASLRDHAGAFFDRVGLALERSKWQPSLNSLQDYFFAPYNAAPVGREETLGRVFPTRQYLLEASGLALDVKNETVVACFILDDGTEHLLLALADADAAHRFLLRNRTAVHSAQLLRLNNTDFLESADMLAEFDFPVSCGFRFVGRHAPVTTDKDGEQRPMTFEELAELPDQETNARPELLRLGAMLLDVDNLGQVFSHGLGTGASLARLATLSRELAWFFTAQFEYRAAQHNIYLIYSGGDDAFVVGKWDRVLQFAQQIYIDFQQFTGCTARNHPNIHFSAGIFQGNPYYPVGRFYRDARRLQDKAKEGTKNRVDVFDHTLTWNSFIDKMDMGALLVPVLRQGSAGKNGKKFSMAFLYRILQLVKSSYYERDQMVDGRPAKRGGLNMRNMAKNIANMRYLFARNGFKQQEIEQLEGELEKKLTRSFLKNAFNFNKKENARDFIVAFNFALLKIRSFKKNTDK
jgi:CRISPR-associated protein Csm1